MSQKMSDEQEDAVAMGGAESGKYKILVPKCDWKQLDMVGSVGLHPMEEWERRRLQKHYRTVIREAEER